MTAPLDPVDLGNADVPALQAPAGLLDPVEDKRKKIPAKELLAPLDPMGLASIALSKPVEAAPVPTLKKVKLRRLDDVEGMRKNVYDYALRAVTDRAPVENATHRLELVDPGYDSDYNPSKADEKKALLQSGSLQRPLFATVRLVDKSNDKVVEEKRMPVAYIPHANSRGMYIRNGVPWILRTQARLRPGVYARKRSDGGSETQFNIQPGTGRGFRIALEPETGIFKLNVEQSTSRLYPILKSLGIADEDMKKAWGDELFDKNSRTKEGSTDSVLRKVVGKLGRDDIEYKSEELPQALTEILGRMKVDPDVTEITTGERFEHVEPKHLFQAANKALSVERGDAEEDNRDSQAFQSVHAPEDLVHERLHRDPARSLHIALWKASKQGNLSKVRPGMMNENITGLFEGSGLSQTPEDVNPFEISDLRQGITRMGEGGIHSEQSVSRAARGIQSSYLGVIDPTRGPESSKMGLDLRVTDAAMKGDDGQLYTQVLNPKTGERTHVSARELSKKVFAFPGEMEKDEPRILAIKNDDITYVPKKEVDYVLEHPQHMFSRSINQIPFAEGIKSQRLLMGARMLQQAVPLKEPEAPFVQVADTDGKSVNDKMGETVGAVRASNAGVVRNVTDDYIEVATPNGMKRYELYNNYPSARKTVLHNTPLVQVGQAVTPGMMLAKSNFTDDKGAAAIGKNLRVAFMAAEGGTLEDAIVISESTAKKLTSESMYKTELENTGIHSRKKNDYVAIYNDKYTPEQLDAVDEDGVVKVGQTVKAGDPIVLAVGKKDPKAIGAVMRSPKSSFSDKSETWDHEAPGVVTDVTKGRHGVTVAIKSYSPAKVGDKLCYSEDTEVLTEQGWKFVKDITVNDRVASLAGGDTLEYVAPVALHTYAHVGHMYNLETTQASLCVTLNHKLYAQTRSDEAAGRPYQLIEAKDLIGKRYRLQNNVKNVNGDDLEFFQFPSHTVIAGQFGHGQREVAGTRIKTEVFMMLLGMFLSEGNVIWQPESGTYVVSIAQVKKGSVAEMTAALAAAGVNYTKNVNSYNIYDKSMVLFFKELHDCTQEGRPYYTKFIPSFVFNYSPRLLKILLRWLMQGDGHVGKTRQVYTTTSRRLAGDIQRLALHVGIAANIRTTSFDKPAFVICAYYKMATRYDVIFYSSNNGPTINHGHSKTQEGQTEKLIDFIGMVYCPELPKNHVLYVRRNGKAVWCGNSATYGNKGVISEIRPDEQMPVLEDGKPVEVLMSPLGIITRTNPALLAVTLLGKVAEKTGQRFLVPSFKTKEGIVNFALQKALEAGVIKQDADGDIDDTETVTDPRDGRKIPKIFVGNQYLLKMHHMSEGKLSARDMAGYTNEGIPAKGGSTGSKRIALMDAHSIISAGATEFLKDAKLIRGQRNDDYWRAIRAGETPIEPSEHGMSGAFEQMLQGAGVAFRKSGTKTQLAPLLDKDVDSLAAHEIENGKTFDFNTMEPEKGGLFDLGATGGADGNRFAKITLPVPVPHPLFVDPIQRLLGLTGKKFEAVLAGQEKLEGKTGPTAVVDALKKIDVDKEMENAKQEIRSGAASKRDMAVKRLNYLDGLKKTDTRPEDLMITKVPVVPPKYRPIIRGPRGNVPHDLNYLYHDLLEAKKNYNSSESDFGEAGEQYLTMMHTLQAISGVKDPVNPKTAEQGVKGILRFAIGVGESPKFAMFQRKMIGSAVDTVGRGVITADKNLKLDEVSIPKDLAWTVFRPYIIRRLVRHGFGAADAVKMVKDQDETASAALNEEMQNRPVVYNRAPSLHRYSYTGGWAKIRDDDSIGFNPHVLKGLGADYDGDSGLTSVLIVSTQEIQSSSYEGDLVMGLSADTRALVKTGVVPLSAFPRIHESAVQLREGVVEYDVPEGVCVYALDPNSGEHREYPVTKFSIHENLDMRLVEIGGRGSSALHVSADHSLICYREGAILAVRPDEAGGLMVPVLKKISPEEGIDRAVQVSAIKVVMTGVKGERYIQRTEQPYERVYALDRSMGFVLGALIGDGWIDVANRVYLAANVTSVREKFISAAKQVFGEDMTDPKVQEADAVSLGGSTTHRWKVSFGSPAAARWIKGNIGDGALQKRIPPFVFNAREDHLLGLLDGLLSTDGAIAISNGKEKPQIVINYATSSADLVDGVQYILRRLGVVSSVTLSKSRVSERAAYVISISSVDMKSLCERTDFRVSHEGKQQVLAQIKQLVSESSAMAASTDLVPYPSHLHQIFSNIGRTLLSGDPDTNASACSSWKAKGSWSRESAERHLLAYYSTAKEDRATLCVNRGNNSLSLPAETLEGVDRYAELVKDREITWKRVESVEVAPRQTGYDLTVPGPLTFATSTGVVIQDTVNVHVPASEEAQKDVVDKLMPSKSLWHTGTYETHLEPPQDYVAGLYLASQPDTKQPVVTFETKEDAKRAYMQGKISARTPVRILKD